MLWLGLDLPRLPLEVFPGEATPSRPFAVTAMSGGMRRIALANPLAREAGIRPGMSLSTALSLDGDLQSKDRDPATEQRALEDLAAWAGQFTSFVSLDPPRGLLLEIEGSLSYFHGLDPLRRQFAAGLAALGFHGHTAVAPTPLGASLLARTGREPAMTDQGDLAVALGELPLAYLDLPDPDLEALRGLGLQQIADCRKLPRDGLARRLGTRFLNDLDRAFGHRPDPRPAFQPPESFDQELPLPAEVTSTQALIFAVRRLVLALCGFLQGRDRGVQHYTLCLFHRDAPADELRLELVSPSRDADHLLALLQERLDRFELQAPVETIALRADKLLPLADNHPRLFAEDRDSADTAERLMERLQAHLGQEAVTGIRPAADYRPEHAWRPCTPGPRQAVSHCPERPLWILERPRPLDTRDGQPIHDGHLEILQGPERIESGWWDGQDVARDYYTARTAAGERLWIFHDLRNDDWFLQGWFG